MDGSVENRKILVTGGSGTIGTYFLNSIKNLKGFSFVCLYHTKKGCLADNISWVQCDLRNKKQLEDVLKCYTPDTCVYLAYDSDNYSLNRNYDLNAINWMFYTFEFFKMFCELGGKLFIFSGTLSEYDFKSSDFSHDNLDPDNLYGRSKKYLRKILFEFPKCCTIVWLQIAGFFGVLQKRKDFFECTTDSILNDKPVILWGCDISYRYAHFKYLGAAIRECLYQKNDGVFPIFGAPTNSWGQYKLEDIAKRIACYYKKEYKIEYLTENIRPANYKYDPTLVPDNIKKVFFNTFENDLIDYLNQKYIKWEQKKL